VEQTDEIIAALRSIVFDPEHPEHLVTPRAAGAVP
jgi:hypothetical protein